jgi:alanine transaminase
MNGTQRNYVLEDETQFQPRLEILQVVYEKAIADGLNVRAIVINNPGNPSGTVVPAQTLEQILRFCEKNRIVVLADEVYQINAYTPENPFVSMRSIAKNRSIHVEMFSFQSTSKGFSAEYE